MNRFHTHSYLLIAVLIATVLAGCGGDGSPLDDPAAPRLIEPDGVSAPEPTSLQPTPPRGRGFYPLAPGDHWTYDRRLEIRIIEIDNVTDPSVGGTRVVIDATVERTMIGVEERFGRDYQVEALVLHVDGGSYTSRAWHRYRQDQAGLYLADVSSREPPGDVSRLSDRIATDTASRPGKLDAGIPDWKTLAALLKNTPPAVARDGWRRHVDRIRQVRALVEPGTGPFTSSSGPPGGPHAEEIVLLRYPLHPGAVFSTRTEPFHVDSVVEALEVLDIPAGRFNGYRIRIENERLDPEDEVYVWRGGCGGLGSFTHLETIAMDVETGEMVRIITEETDWLSEIELNEPGRCRTGKTQTVR